MISQGVGLSLGLFASAILLFGCGGASHYEMGTQINKQELTSHWTPDHEILFMITFVLKFKKTHRVKSCFQA